MNRHNFEQLNNADLDALALAAETAAPPKLDGRKIKFERTSTNVIMATIYPPLRPVIPGYVYPGFTVLAGRQKLGKTWLGIDWAAAVATGGCCMGTIPCEQGDVLYIDMENGPRRIQGRINTLYPDERTCADGGG